MDTSCTATVTHHVYNASFPRLQCRIWSGSCISAAVEARVGVVLTADGVLWQLRNSQKLLVAQPYRVGARPEISDSIVQPLVLNLK